MAAFVPGRRAHFCPRAVLGARRLGSTGPPRPPSRSHEPPAARPGPPRARRRADRGGPRLIGGRAPRRAPAGRPGGPRASRGGGAGADPVLPPAGDTPGKPAPVPGGPPCHYGETADLIPATPSAKAASTVASPAATDVLVLGDVQYECGDLPFFTSRYGPTWGQFKAITQPVIGNHEYDTAPGTTTCDPGTTTPAKGYFDYFNGVGVQTGPAGDRSKGYYSYDLGTWHIVVLNSNCTIVSCSAGSAQETFLRQDLAAHPAVCTLAAWHHPRFSSSNAASSSTQPLWQDLYDA